MGLVALMRDKKCIQSLGLKLLKQRDHMRDLDVDNIKMNNTGIG
jgi:hypothetical protein